MGDLYEHFVRAIDLEDEARTLYVHELQGEAPGLADELTRLLAAHETNTELGMEEEPAREAGPPPGTLLVGRYRLRGPIGSGRFGTVQAADDELHGRPVAIKFMTERGAAQERVWREVAVLRRLRLPGIAQLLDEGRFGGAAFLVMDRVRGLPFPGHDLLREEMPWEAWIARCRSLLEALDRMHAHGVLHCDLKPQNVLVDERGSVTIVDLGSAVDRGPGLGRPGRLRFGTLRYLAPELLDGEPPTARSDLYAVGVLLEDAAAERGLLPRMRELVRALTQEIPEQRPVSARAALEMLTDEAPRQSSFTFEASSLEAEGGLEARLAGPERILHLRSDGASELRALAGGDVDTLNREVESMLHAGRAELVGTRLRIRRKTIDELRTARLLAEDRSDTGPRALLQLLEQGAWTEARTLGIRLAREALDRGELGTASALLGEAANWSARAGEALSPEHCAALLSCSLLIGTPNALDQTLHLLERHGPRGSSPVHVELAKAAALALQGDARRSLALSEDLDTGGCAETAFARISIRALSARCLREDPETRGRILDEIEAWQSARNDDVATASLHEWRGWAAYGDGDFERAAIEHDRAAAHSESSPRRTSRMLNAASCHLEACAFARCEELAREARDAAARGRWAFLEARAERLLREAGYRAGRAQPEDPELHEAVQALGHAHLTAQLEVALAAARWRAGGDAREMAASAANNWERSGDQDAAILARCFAALLDPQRRHSLQEDVQRARRLPLPGLRAQSLALCAWAGAAPFAELEPEIRAAWEELGLRDEHARREVLSPAESASPRPPKTAFGPGHEADPADDGVAHSE